MCEQTNSSICSEGLTALANFRTNSLFLYARPQVSFQININGDDQDGQVCFFDASNQQDCFLFNLELFGAGPQGYVVVILELSSISVPNSDAIRSNYITPQLPFLLGWFFPTQELAYSATSANPMGNMFPVADPKIFQISYQQVNQNGDGKGNFCSRKSGSGKWDCTAFDFGSIFQPYQKNATLVSLVCNIPTSNSKSQIALKRQPYTIRQFSVMICVINSNTDFDCRIGINAMNGYAMALQDKSNEYVVVGTSSPQSNSGTVCAYGYCSNFTLSQQFDMVIKGDHHSVMIWEILA